MSPNSTTTLLFECSFPHVAVKRILYWHGSCCSTSPRRTVTRRKQLPRPRITQPITDYASLCQVPFAPAKPPVGLTGRVYYTLYYITTVQQLRETRHAAPAGFMSTFCFAQLDSRAHQIMLYPTTSQQAATRQHETQTTWCCSANHLTTTLTERAYFSELQTGGQPFA